MTVLVARDVPHLAVLYAETEISAVAVAVRHVIDLWDERREPRALHGLARRERHGAVGAAVEGAAEGDKRRAPGGVARQLDRALDRFGPRVREKDTLLARSGSERRQPL